MCSRISVPTSCGPAAGDPARTPAAAPAMAGGGSGAGGCCTTATTGSGGGGGSGGGTEARTTTGHGGGGAPAAAAAARAPAARPLQHDRLRRRRWRRLGRRRRWRPPATTGLRRRAGRRLGRRWRSRDDRLRSRWRRFRHRNEPRPALFDRRRRRTLRLLLDELAQIVLEAVAQRPRIEVGRAAGDDRLGDFDHVGRDLGVRTLDEFDRRELFGDAQSRHHQPAAMRLDQRRPLALADPDMAERRPAAALHRHA